MDRLVRFYRRLSTTARSVIVFVLAVSVALATMHALTFSATAITKKTGEEDPGIVLNQDPENEDFDNVSEGTGTDNPEEKPSEPAETPAAPEVQEGEPSPEPSAMPEEPGTEPEVTAAPEETGAPEETEAPEEVIIAEEEQSGAELLSEEPEEESDPTADIETAADWEKLFRDIEFTGVWADDLLAVAESQIGYRESKANFIRDEENIKRGYTRYGAWYGDAYAKWDSLFVLFSMYYTGITIDQFPFKADCEDWIEALKEKELFFEADDYVPNKGDLVFADTDEDGEADYVAIVKAVETKEGESDKLVVIEGDSGDEVKESRHEFNNPLILGYAQLPENPELAEEEEPEAEPVYASFEGKANNVEVTVLYEEGAFPEGTTMKVKPVWNPSVLGAINDTVTDKEVVKVQAVDIAFYDAEGKEIEPEKPIKVTMKSTSIPKQAEETPTVVHVDDKLNTEVVEAEQAEEAEKPTEAVTFESGAFSVYAIVYTVDFAYSLDGRVFTFSMEGGTSMKLSALVEALGIIEETSLENGKAFVAEVKNVEFTDSSLLKVSKDFFGFGDDWTLTSLAPFTSQEALTITMNNGNVFTIDVTDAQEVAGNDFITDAHLTVDGTTYGKNDTWNVYPDANYDMKLSFAEKGSTQFPKGGDTIVVNLPTGLTIPEGEHHTFDIPAGLAGTITGNEYWVENGKLYVKFGPDPDEILRRSSNAHFELSFNASFEEGTTQLGFNGRVHPDINMDTTADVTVDKSANYNSATGKMEYTITVKSTGKSENVTVSDRMASSNLLTIDQNSITVEPASTTYTKTSRDNGFDMVIPSIGHNQTVIIKYTADVNEAALDHKGNIKVSDDGKNTVTVENDDDSHDEETNTYTHEIKYSNTSKTSTSVVDHETAEGENKTATLGWLITLNDNYRGSIVGDKITDTIHWDNKDAMKYTKNPDGTVTLNIVAKSQDGTTYPPKSVNATVTTNINGQESWEYTIPQFGDNPDEILSYEISYTTEVDKTKMEGYTNGIVKNNVDNEGDGGSQGTGVVPGVTPEGGEHPGTDDIIGGKSAVKVTPEYIDWDIVFAIPPEGFPNGFVIVDEIPNGADLGRKFADTFDSILSVTGLHDNEDYSDEVTKESHNNLTPKQKDILTITFYQDKDKTDPGLDAGSATRTITVRIRTKNDPDWVKFADTANGGEQAIYHTNKAKANNSDWFTDRAAPMHTQIDKEKERNMGTETVDGVQLPKYEYSVVLTNVTELPVVITDTFNSDELVFIGTGEVSSGHHLIAANSQKNNLNGGVDGYAASYDASTPGTLTITANDLPKKPDGSFYEFYKIYYTMRVKDKAALDSFTQKAIENGGVYKVGNTAKWNGADDHVDIDFTVPAVEKTGDFRKNSDGSSHYRLFDFSIEINKDCQKLNGGTPMNLTDTHTPNLTVDYTTVKIFKYVDGVETLDTSIEWNFDGNIGTFYSLLDSTHYRIAYSCLVTGSGNQEFSNYAEMNGFHDEKHASHDYGTSAGGGADVLQIGLIKFKNGMTSRGLQGATFQLFRGTGHYTWVTEGENSWGVEEKEPMTWGYGTETEGKVGQPITFTTNGDGYLQIALNQSDHGAELEEGVHYYLKEIESPPGYQIDSSVEYWEFTLTMNPDEVCYGTERDEYNNRKWIYFYYDDILKMNNTETSEPLTVNVDKEWFNINGAKVEEPDNNLRAKVQLYQKKNDEDYVAVENITNKDGVSYPGLITLPFNNEWKYTWDNLPRRDDDGNVYAYKLEEVEIPDDYASSSSIDETENQKTYHFKNYKIAERQVNVSVSKTWKDEDGNTIEIAKLPPDIQNIRFNIYRVVSRVPFTTAPTSGGNPYVIEGSQYLASDGSEDSGMYIITRDDFGGVTFNNLPSVEKVTEGETETWYFYSYYVKEIATEGYNAVVTVEEETDSITSNKILINSITNNKAPEPTNLHVQKVWKDKTGKEVSWPKDMVVQFELYQVSSKTPFTQQPESGGSLYDVKMPEHQTHPNKVPDKPGLYQIGHTYNGTLYTTADFSKLPAVTYNSKHVPTYYAYYVKEIAVDGYVTSYSNDKSESGRTITITNQKEPESTSISVEKKWYEQDGTTEITDPVELKNLSAEVELVRYRADPVGTTVHFTSAKQSEPIKSILVPRNTSGIVITVSSISGANGVAYTTEFDPSKEGDQYTSDSSISQSNLGVGEIVINTPDVSDIYVVSLWSTMTAIEASTEAIPAGGAPSIDTTFNSTHSTQWRRTLDADGEWKTVYSGLPITNTVNGVITDIYSYGIREVSNPAGFEFMSYGDVGVNESDTAEIKASNPAGSVVVNNKKSKPQTTNFTFFKEWEENTTRLTWPKGSEDKPLSIAVKVGRTINNSEDTSFSLTYQIGGDSLETGQEIAPSSGGTAESPKLKVTIDESIPTYQFSLDGLDVMDSNGVKYSYFVEEIAVPEGYKLAFYKSGRMSDSHKGLNEWSIVNQPADSYVLPKTGGSGTGMITILGSIFILAGAGVLLLRRRRESL